MYQGSIQHKNNATAAREIANSIKCNCQHCSKQTNKANIKKHEASCYLNPINFKPCAVCGGPVKLKEATTCSHSCSNKHFRRGPSNGSWEGKNYRTICFHHHEKKCVVCGEDKIVEVHHLDEDHKNDDPKNLVEAIVIAYAEEWSKR
jgi:hypothetical protein